MMQKPPITTGECLPNNLLVLVCISYTTHAYVMLPETGQRHVELYNVCLFRDRKQLRDLERGQV